MEEKEKKLANGTFKGHFTTYLKKSGLSPLLVGVALSGITEN